MEYFNLILTHWPFVAAFAIFFVIARALKKGPLSPDRAQEVPWVRWVRRWLPLPIHPIIWGMCLGLVPGLPLSPDIEPGTGAAVLYFGGAGALSIVIYDIRREWQKYRKK